MTAAKKFRHHLLGSLLVLAALGSLFVLPWLPMSGDRVVPGHLLADNPGRYALVFFGYAGCSSICPPSLALLGDMARRYEQAYGDGLLDISFIHLLPDASPARVTAYARAFHPKFIVYQPQAAQLAALQQAFGVYGGGASGPVEAHSGYIYLLAKTADNWHIYQVYPGVAAVSAERLWADLQNYR